MLQHFKLTDIENWQRFYRANFINSLTGFKPISLIGSVNKEGRPNLAIFSSIIHLGSDPALVGYINRPLAAAHHTFENIVATGVYTINHIHSSFVKQAHQTSAKYADEVNEFEAVALETAYYDGIKAPFVAASKVKYALTLQEVIPITCNNTLLVIGSISTILIESSLIQQDGFLALETAGSLASLGADAYYTQEKLIRLSYAKPETPVKEI